MRPEEDCESQVTVHMFMKINFHTLEQSYLIIVMTNHEMQAAEGELTVRFITITITETKQKTSKI